MNYPSCFYGGENCADLPYWLIFAVSGLLATFVLWNYYRYKSKKTEHLLSLNTRKQIFIIIIMLIVIGILIPWTIDAIMK